MDEIEDIAIVVISDVHAGSTNAFAELTHAPGVSPETKPVPYASLRDELLTLVGPIPPARRFLVCPGDLSSSTHSQELLLACGFLNSLATDLVIPLNHRAIVPGNHDLDWSLTALGKTDPWYLHLRQSKYLELVRAHIPTFTTTAAGLPGVLSALERRVALLLLDSAFEDAHDHKPHCGRIGEAQLRACEAQLSSVPEDALRVAVLHHHVIQVRRDTDSTDHSILSDARDLLEFLKRHRFSLLIHGHGHRPHVEIIGTQRLTILGAGSVGAARLSLPDEQRNTVHVVVLGRQTGGELSGSIRTAEYARTQNRWVRESILGVHSHSPQQVFFFGDTKGARLDAVVTAIFAEARARGFVNIEQYCSVQQLADGESAVVAEMVRRRIDSHAERSCSLIPIHGGRDLQVHLDAPGEFDV